MKKRFVAVTCHSDIIDWLQPDWVLDMASGRLARGSLRRPEITLAIHKVSTAGAWPLFKKHHYLSADIHPGTQSFVATWDGQLVAYCGIMANFSHFDSWRISRIVTLPDFQGVGIGSKFIEEVARYWKELKGGKVRISIVSTHPGIRNHCVRSPLWKLNDFNKYGKSRGTAGKHTKLRYGASGIREEARRTSFPSTELPGFTQGACVEFPAIRRPSPHSNPFLEGVLSGRDTGFASIPA